MLEQVDSHDHEDNKQASGWTPNLCPHLLRPAQPVDSPTQHAQQPALMTCDEQAQLIFIAHRY